MQKNNSQVSKLTTTQQDVAHNETKDTPNHPNGWEPGVEFNYKTKTGTITTRAMDNASPQFDDLLRSWGFDPEKYYILNDTIRVSTWDMNLGKGDVQQAWAYKAQIIYREHALDQDDYDRISKWIQTYKRKAKPKITKPKASFFVAISDLQLGKRDGGGTEAIVNRFLDKIDTVRDRYNFLRKAGVQLDQLTVVGLGDIVEGCVGFYPQAMGPNGVELDYRNQMKLARRIIAKALVEWSKDFDLVVVGAVPGNHGTKRIAKGIAPTGEMDNYDIEVFEQIAEIFADKPQYKHVKFVIPDEPHLSLNVCGTNISFTHGHLSTGSGNIENKIMNWWKNQTFGGFHSGGSSILVTGHYHHHREINDPRTWIQVPSLDESTYFEHQAGKKTKQGVMTMVVDKNGHNNKEIV